MKMSEVPLWAYDAKPTPLPTKLVPDWDALYETLCEQGFVLLYAPAETVRTTNAGAEESPLVKGFNSHVRTTKKRRLLTKRIGAERWFCVLA